MDSTIERSLHARAKRRYELARLRTALPWGLPAIAAATVATLVTSEPGCLAVGFFVGAASFGLLWYGRGAERAVPVGIGSGATAMLIGLLGRVCVDNSLECAVFCMVGGMLMAWLVARAAAHNPRSRGLMWATSVAMGLPLAALGCVGLGVAGAIGLVLGLALGSAPALGRALYA